MMQGRLFGLAVLVAIAGNTLAAQGPETGTGAAQSADNATVLGSDADPSEPSDEGGEGGEGGEELGFDELDADGDGIISRQEAERAGGVLPARWNRVDRDRDGRVDREEFAAFEADRGADTAP